MAFVSYPSGFVIPLVGIFRFFAPLTCFGCEAKAWEVGCQHGPGGAGDPGWGLEGFKKKWVARGTHL